MASIRGIPPDSARRLTWPVRLTLAGMLAERVSRAFWPLWTLVLVALAALMLGLHDILPLEVVWTVGVAMVLGAGGALVRGATRFRWPSREEALDRLDRTLPGRPIEAISDTQAIGAGDAASEAVWNAHVARMEERLKEARAAKPDLQLSRRDPYALRYIALTGFVVALIFGSVLRVATVAEVARPGGDALAAGPAWEGWVEPPFYTGQPSLYLNDIDRDSFDVPEGSRVTIRFYGEVGALTLHETVSGRTEDVPAATDPGQSFEVAQSGTLRIDGPGGQEWAIEAVEDQPPEIEFEGPIAQGQGGRMEAPFVAKDDHGVVAGRLEIVLDLPEVERRYGLSLIHI